ncbi:MAG: hypothetical protein K6T88_04200 [Bacillus sp. (in: Bacteria)]|nr:hypothetical protein [Bacillus sp. (in: firmicutes)]
MTNEVEHTYVLTLPMNTTDFDLYRFDKVFEVSRKIQNACLGEILKRDRIVRDNKKYPLYPGC